jgi:hypothetical protein
VINPSFSWANPQNHSLGADPQLTYPNGILHTHIVYSTGSNAATQFPFPIPFTEADYGPGI